MIFRHLLNMRSHPTWVRGLKPYWTLTTTGCWIVAPYVGAWIETRTSSRASASQLVAPYVGAWIETSCPLSVSALRHVAPYVGAWIETRHTPMKLTT